MAFKNNLLFEYLENILKNKSIEQFNKHVNDELFQSFPKFILLKYLTMHTNEKVRLIVLNNYLTFERMPNKTLYKYLLNNIPKQYNSFIKFLK